MHFSLVALLVSTAILVQSAPYTQAAAMNFTNAARNTSAFALSGPNFNPVKITIPAGMKVECSAKTFASNHQEVDVSVSGEAVANFYGSGENSRMGVTVYDDGASLGIERRDGDFTIVPRTQAYDLVLRFRFIGKGLTNAVVKNAPSPKVDNIVTSITIGSEDSIDDDNDDVVFKLVYYPVPGIKMLPRSKFLYFMAAAAELDPRLPSLPRPPRSIGSRESNNIDGILTDLPTFLMGRTSFMLSFQFDAGNGPGLQDAVVKNAPSVEVNDIITTIKIGSEDSTDDDNNDEVFQLVYYPVPGFSSP
ncbi:hypothetical protein BU17DRAFT_65063 [Hysterangium stoloniferum]|nr:hypothetical protein BU17DRAFT_65063 [Hysterangium stoloniferum]